MWAFTPSAASTGVLLCGYFLPRNSWPSKTPPGQFGVMDVIMADSQGGNKTRLHTRSRCPSTVRKNFRETCLVLDNISFCSVSYSVLV